MKRRAWCAAATVGTLLLGACADRNAYEGSAMVPSLTVPGTRLPGDPDTISLANPGGMLTLVSFGFTECPDICPTTLSDWHRVREQLGADTSRVRFLFVSVDFRKDTPTSAAEFARRFDPTFIGVALDSVRLKPFLSFFQAEAAYTPSPSGKGSEVGHTTHSYLIEGSGRIALVYTFASEPEPIARDIRRMAAKESGR